MLGEKEEEGNNRLLTMSEEELEMGRKKEAEAIRASMGTPSSFLRELCFLSSALLFVIIIQTDN